MGSDLNEHILLIVSRNSLTVLCLYITKVYGSVTGNPPQHPILKQVNKFRTFVLDYNTIPPIPHILSKRLVYCLQVFIQNMCIYSSYPHTFCVRVPTELPTFDGVSCCIYQTAPNWRIFGKHHTLDID